MAAVAGLAITVTAEAEEWPFATIEGFQERANNARSLSGAIYVSVNPLVKVGQLDRWESYVQSSANSWM
jgi:hypothetical protein